PRPTGHAPPAFEAARVSKTRRGGTPKRRARRILTGCFAFMSIIPSGGLNPGPALDSATGIVRSPSRLHAQLKLNPRASNRTRFEAGSRRGRPRAIVGKPHSRSCGAYSSIDEEACAVLPICLDLAEC